MNFITTLKVLLLLCLINISYCSFAQLGAFRLRGNSGAINVGYINYRYLTFGIGENNTPDGPFAIEHWNGGLNFCRPWNNSDYGNYNLFIYDYEKVCINMKNDDRNSTNKILTNNFQVRGYGQADGWWNWSDSTLKRNIEPL